MNISAYFTAAKKVPMRYFANTERSLFRVTDGRSNIDVMIKSSRDSFPVFRGCRGRLNTFRPMGLVDATRCVTRLTRETHTNDFVVVAAAALVDVDVDIAVDVVGIFLVMLLLIILLLLLLLLLLEVVLLLLLLLWLLLFFLLSLVVVDSTNIHTFF